MYKDDLSENIKEMRPGTIPLQSGIVEPGYCKALDRSPCSIQICQHSLGILAHEQVTPIRYILARGKDTRGKLYGSKGPPLPQNI